VLETIPFLNNRTRVALANDYVPAADHKALAISTGPIGFVTNQQSDEAARGAALDLCQKRAENVQPPRKCEIYGCRRHRGFCARTSAVPPLPWIKHDPTIEKPFSGKESAADSRNQKSRSRQELCTRPQGQGGGRRPGRTGCFLHHQDTPEEAARRALENCGYIAGVPCMVVALDDFFVVPVPTTLRVVGFFRPASNSSIAPDAREDVARRLNVAPSGWNAVAVGASGRPGLALKASNEQDAVNDALGNCVKQDHDCHVVAVGPFLVGPN